MIVRPLITLAGLVAAWCAIWGSVSAANLLSGVAVGVLALALGSGRRGRGGVRLLPMAHLAWLVFVDLGRSTIAVVREVLTPTDYTDEAIIAVPLPPGARHHLLLLYVAITVTPGTAVVAGSADTSVVYLHVLHADRRDEVEAHVIRLGEIAERAFPVAATRDAGQHDGAAT